MTSSERSTPRRVLVHDHSGHGFPIELSRELARRGEVVLHLTCSSFPSARGPLAPRPDDPPGLTIDALDHGEPFDRYRFGHRVRQELRYARRFADRAAAFGPDVVLNTNTPLFAQWRMAAWARRQRIPFVLWLQDIYSAAMGTAVRERLGRAGAAPAAGFTAIDRAALRSASAVVAISDDFVSFVLDAGVHAHRVEVIENWAPLDDVPLLPPDNEWARAHDLVDVDVALYSGTLGLKHDPSLLGDLARAAEHRGGTRVVVISEGLGADWLRAQDGLPALAVLPYQDHGDLAAVLAAADVLLAVLEPDAGTFSVPSKILNYHAAGRPIVAALPGENLAARTITGAGSGTVVPPGDREAFVDEVLALLDDPGRRAELGAAARAHAEATFAIGPIADRFEEILAVAEADGRTDREAEFWDEHALPLDLCLELVAAGPEPNTAELLDAVGPVEGRRVLDFACGSGLTVAWLAQRGADVVGFDVSPASIERAGELLDALGLEADLRLGTGPEGDLGRFDAMIGRFALHHVDLEAYAPWLASHLEPGGRGAFLETMASNPVLAVSRRALPGRFGVLKMGSDDERPLRREDLDLLARHFDGVRRTVGELNFLTLIDRRALKGRLPVLGRALRGTDRLLQRLPGTTGLSYHQVVHVVGR